MRALSPPELFPLPLLLLLPLWGGSNVGRRHNLTLLRPPVPDVENCEAEPRELPTEHRCSTDWTMASMSGLASYSSPDALFFKVHLIGLCRASSAACIRSRACLGELPEVESPSAAGTAVRVSRAPALMSNALLLGSGGASGADQAA